MKRKWWGGIFAALGMLVLILDSKTAISGAREGLALCIQSVIPSLMPFIFLSQLLVNALIGQNSRIFALLEQILHIPHGSGSIYVAGLLGGYPTGAQLVAQAYRDGVLSRKDANRMLFFTSNAGPAFIFGILSTAFSNSVIPWVLWLIHISSSVLVAQIIPGAYKRQTLIPRASTLSLASALKRTVMVMAQICGWVTLFKVLCIFIDRWFLFILSDEVHIWVTGLLELTAGCTDLPQIKSEGLRMILSSAFLSFGGLCVAMQTAGVCSQLQLKNYLLGKILQSLVSILMGSIAQYFLCEPTQTVQIHPMIWFIIGLPLAFFVLYLRKSEKNSSISRPNGVQLVPR